MKSTRGEQAMKIRDIEVFQVSWSPADKPEQRSAWVRVYCDDGSFGIGEASPMQGGLASLGIIARNLAPALLAGIHSIMRCCSTGCCTPSPNSGPRGR